MLERTGAPWRQQKVARVTVQASIKGMARHRSGSWRMPSLRRRDGA